MFGLVIRSVDPASLSAKTESCHAFGGYASSSSQSHHFLLLCRCQNVEEPTPPLSLLADHLTGVFHVDKPRTWLSPVGISPRDLSIKHTNPRGDHITGAGLRSTTARTRHYLLYAAARSRDDLHSPTRRHLDSRISARALALVLPVSLTGRLCVPIHVRFSTLDPHN